MQLEARHHRAGSVDVQGFGVQRISAPIGNAPAVGRPREVGGHLLALAPDQELGEAAQGWNDLDPAWRLESDSGAVGGPEWTPEVTGDVACDRYAAPTVELPDVEFHLPRGAGSVGEQLTVWGEGRVYFQGRSERY